MNDVKIHFDNIAENYDRYKSRNKYYYYNLKKLLASLIPRNKVVLEIGCGTGDLLVFLKPKVGYGIDISPKMIEFSVRKYHSLDNIHFSTRKISDFKGKKLDYIFMSDVIEHVSDIDGVFKGIANIMNKNTRLICTYANPKWELILSIAEIFKMKMPEGQHHRWSFNEIESTLLENCLNIIDHDYSLLFPVKIFTISDLINTHFGKYFKRSSFIEYFIAEAI